MIKRVMCVLAAAIIISSGVEAQIKIGGKTIGNKNTSKLLEAAADVVQAVTLSDSDVAAMCKESVVWMDENNTVAPVDSEYAKRLEKLTNGVTEAKGVAVNFKVYMVKDINAFASGDGSIRVFAGLMDVMSDEELVAIIGHEIGHVANKDVKNAIQSAYSTSAALKGLGAISDKMGKLTSSQLSEIATAFTDAQFSQKQEREADDYGFAFAIEKGFSEMAMANSLNRLVELYGGGDKGVTAMVQKMFSSHPDSEARAKRMTEKAEEYREKK